MIGTDKPSKIIAGLQDAVAFAKGDESKARVTTRSADNARRVSLDEQIACVRREIAMRERVYPRLVEAGRMGRKKADREIAAMQSVLTTLEEIAARRVGIERAGTLILEAPHDR